MQKALPWALTLFALAAYPIACGQPALAPSVSPSPSPSASLSATAAAAKPVLSAIASAPKAATSTPPPQASASSETPIVMGRAPRMPLGCQSKALRRGRQLLYDPRSLTTHQCEVKLSPDEQDWVLSQAWPNKRVLCDVGDGAPDTLPIGRVLSISAVSGHFTDTSRLQQAFLVWVNSSDEGMCGAAYTLAKLLIFDEQKLVATWDVSTNPHTGYEILPAFDTDGDGLSELLFVHGLAWMGTVLQGAELLTVHQGQVSELLPMGEMNVPFNVTATGNDTHSAVVVYFTPKTSGKDSESRFDYQLLEGHCSHRSASNPETLVGCPARQVPWRVVKRGPGTVPPNDE